MLHRRHEVSHGRQVNLHADCSGSREVLFERERLLDGEAT
jgi:hypothetical protein